MLYSDSVAMTGSTSADTNSADGTLTYNGVGGQVYFVWLSGGDATHTAAEGAKPYVLVRGDGVPGQQPNLPLGMWRSASLATASVGSNSGDATALPVNWRAPPSGSITVNVRNAASTAAELYHVGVIYGSGSFAPWCTALGPFVLQDVPTTYITATPTSVTTTTELSIGSLTIPAGYPNVLAVTTYAVTNGVRTTAEEFLGVCRYSATGVQGGQFEPSQEWPWFGQQTSPVGTDIQSESFPAGQLWHPLRFTCAANSTLQSLVTLRTAFTNATSFQIFAALR